MIVNNLFGVVHAAVTYFNSVPVEDFPKFVASGEVFVYQGEEFVPDVSFDVFTEWWVIPEDVISLPVFPFGSLGWFVVEGVVVSVLVECFLVWRSGCVECCFVR